MSGCIEHPSTTSTAWGYKRIWSRTEQRRVMAHRAAWEAANGPIPAGMLVLHRCDNPPCVNVAHLFLGTTLDNARDRKAKGRNGPRPHLLGAQNAATRYSFTDVQEMRRLRSQGWTFQSIADHFDCAIATAWRIATERTRVSA